MERSLRQLRTLHGASLSTVVLIAAAGEWVNPLEASAESWLVTTVLAVMAVADLCIGFVLRKNMLEPAVDTLRRTPNDPAALKQWHGGQVISIVFAETVAFFGLVVRFLSGARELALPFYIVSFVVLILWRPRRPDA